MRKMAEELSARSSPVQSIPAAKRRQPIPLYSEAAPADLLAWTEGHAVVGVGSPLPQ